MLEDGSLKNEVKTEEHQTTRPGLEVKKIKVKISLIG
jgi:hypothetical protein